MRKEFARFFGDRRMIISMILPAVLIYVIYSFMGTALQSMFSPDEGYTPVAYAVYMPDSIAGLMQMIGIDVEKTAAGDVAGIKEMITNKERDFCIVFPQGFDELVAAYDPQASANPGPAPNIEVYYNSTVPNSSDIYMRVLGVLDVYESALANKFDVNRDITDSDRASQEDVSASVISSIMPMLLMIFLYTGCMGLALESITGEKERGTIATLLVTPLKRSELAIGKVLSLAVLSFLSGLVMAVATISSIPKLMGGASEEISANIYGAVDYAYLTIIILSTLLLLVTLVSIISAFSKTVKEASTSVIPLMVVVMLAGVSGMFGGAQKDALYYLIPLYSSAQSMSGIFARDYSGMNIVISCLSNLVFACLGGFVLTKMFNSEKIMFAR
jgi:sodium transport system permease protein